MAPCRWSEHARVVSRGLRRHRRCGRAGRRSLGTADRSPRGTSRPTAARIRAPARRVAGRVGRSRSVSGRRSNHRARDRRARPDPQHEARQKRQPHSENTRCSSGSFISCAAHSQHATTMPMPASTSSWPDAVRYASRPLPTDMPAERHAERDEQHEASSEPDAGLLGPCVLAPLRVEDAIVDQRHESSVEIAATRARGRRATSRMSRPRSGRPAAP